jgi:SAM-dependent methyltransferase
MFEAAMEHNLNGLRRVVRERSFPEAIVCDIGCWDGETFLRYAPPHSTLLGFDRNEDAVSLAHARGIDAATSDLDHAWPLPGEAVDIVTSNQVIEHVADTDHFVSEVFRILRPGGTAVISTENLASWHNIAALSLGWQPFSITNVSEMRPSIGNPLSNLRYGEDLGPGWQHVRVFARRGLIELFEAHGFIEVVVTGSGYYPLPAAVGHWDPRHAAFVTVVARRPS